MKMPERNHVVGSCRGGWLLLMEKTPTLSLLSLWNPYSDVRINDLPSTNLHIGEHWVTKAALVGSNPKEYGVVIMYGNGDESGNLAFAKQGDSEWTKFGTEFYWDVNSVGNCIITLSSLILDQLDNQVEVWEFISDNNSSTLVRTMKIRVSFPLENFMPEVEQNHKYTNQFYILQEEEEEGGRILLVMRWIGKHVDENNNLYTLDELAENCPDKICPYKTMNFYVFELDKENRRWVRVSSLDDDQVLFVGGNQTVSWRTRNDDSCCYNNSIYFTDDWWDRMEDEEENEYYGGHDIGIYNFGHGNIRQIHPFLYGKVAPPFWILP